MTAKRTAKDDLWGREHLHPSNINPDTQKTIINVPDTIQPYITEGEHFWHYSDEVVSDICQRPDEPICSDCKYVHNWETPYCECHTCKNVYSLSSYSGQPFSIYRPFPRQLMVYISQYVILYCRYIHTRYLYIARQ